MKIVINKCFGGFGLSELGDIEYLTRSGKDMTSWEVERTDPILISMIEEDSETYSGQSAKLVVVEIPDNVDWHISDYDGREHIAEKHRTWG